VKFQKGNKAAKGRKKGSKSRVCDSFYREWLEAYGSLGGVPLLIDFANSSKHNMAIFLSWGAKTMPSNIQLGNTPDSQGKAQALLVKVVYVGGGDPTNGGGNGDGDGNNALKHVLPTT